MNVASPELCKELFKISGWDYSVAWSRLSDPPDGREDWMLGTPHSQAIERYPAYDLGYLLRKLHEPIGRLLFVPKSNNTWGLWADNMDAINAETPEDAACKLAIELFKRGILLKS